MGEYGMEDRRNLRDMTQAMAGSQAVAGSQGVKAPPSSDNPFARVEHNADEMLNLADRLSRLADRIAGCGSAPETDARSQLSAAKPQCLIGAIDDAMDRVSAALSSAHFSCTRIEQVLP